jgi:hypothetical protein
LGPIDLGVTETQIIGGKFPDLRDAAPVAVFHNDFKDGYTNSAFGLDAVLRLPLGFILAGELYLDDVKYEKTEGEGNTASLFGYLASVRHSFSAGGWAWSQSLHAIRTDPYLYGYLQPLNSMASRRVLASNFQDENDPIFIDRYVVDYPIGYLRGGDAFDFWYRVETQRRALRLTAAAALLAQGEVDLHASSRDDYRTGRESPTGVAEREIRLRLGADYRLPRGLGLHAGLGWQDVRNEGHERGRRENRSQVALGASWTLRP